MAEVAAPALPYQPPLPRAYRPRIGVIGAGFLAALLPLDRLFGAEAEDGSLDQLLLSGLHPAGIAAVKALGCDVRRVLAVVDREQGGKAGQKSVVVVAVVAAIVVAVVFVIVVVAVAAIATAALLSSASYAASIWSFMPLMS